MTAGALARQYGPWIIAAIGGLVMAVGVWMVSSGLASYRWPTAQGMVTSHRIVSEYQQGARTQTVNHAEARYSYEVSGVPYTGNRYAIGRGPDATGGFDQAAEAATKAVTAYPVGGRVTVYYNPDDPGDAVLRRGADWTTGVPLAIGALILGAGAWLARFNGSLG
ncbi:DUF3592 domain-containing protein [Lolliginicoccus suaedae]|uniref:DUF3592 domain-containing protein n=1 Tax=Lolliginicoccus suaedae TaxID=2605429 RepID=UPI0011EE6C40|nr:DUF3592 domain-containing protein [Lolliginicoccus suaedae]